MSQRSKRPQNNQSPTDNKDTSSDKPNKRHVYVEPGVKIDLVQDLKEKYNAAQENSGEHNRKQLFWTKASTVILLGYSIITLLMYKANRDAADAAQTAAGAASRQLKDSEIVQSARLSFEDFTATIISGTAFIADVAISVRNNGPTTASDLNFSPQWGTYNLQYNSHPEPAKGNVKPTPSPSGPSLGPWQKRAYSYRVGANSSMPSDLSVNIPGLGNITIPNHVSSDDVLEGKQQFFITPSVSYTDIFGVPHITTDCFTYNIRVKQWTPCPNLHQHD
jgi:hypothetical protein